MKSLAELNEESDDLALVSAIEKNLTSDQAAAMWKARWDISPCIRSEFYSCDLYVAYMNGCFLGRISRPALRPLLRRRRT